MRFLRGFRGIGADMKQRGFEASEANESDLRSAEHCVIASPGVQTAGAHINALSRQVAAKEAIWIEAAE